MQVPSAAVSGTVETSVAAEPSATVNIGRASCLVDNSVSTRSRSRSPVAAFVPTVGCYLASGDTVCVRPSNTCHQFQGRIISIDKMERNIIFLAHPFISNQSLIKNSNFCVEIQLFLPRDSNIFQRMNVVIPQRLPELAAVDISEMLESNLIIWILPSQITNIVFFIHH
mmetsp:Transcript_2214/g.5167  ORF Transcript_2214/g.5167 Transcript_2214/m.5167 type:complete len:169 (+) Transcript_2214:111-617(+)